MGRARPESDTTRALQVAVAGEPVEAQDPDRVRFIVFRDHGNPGSAFRQADACAKDSGADRRIPVLKELDMAIPCADESIAFSRYHDELPHHVRRLDAAIRGSAVLVCALPQSQA